MILRLSLLSVYIGDKGYNYNKMGPWGVLAYITI